MAKESIDEYIQTEKELDNIESKAPTGKSVSFWAHPVKATAAAVMAAYIGIVGMQAVTPTTANAGQAYAAVSSEQYNSRGFRTPEVSSSRLMKVVYKDLTPRIRGKETKVEVYKARNGTVFNRFSINGKVFKYLVDTDRKRPFEYALVDSRGTGKFDVKKDANSKNYIPNWVL